MPLLDEPGTVKLEPAPDGMAALQPPAATAAAVRVRVESVVIPTYLPAAPDRNPMFLEKRVYQGSSGRVYPLPFTDRISETKTDREWKTVWLENEFLRVMILPEIGGRIHAIQDKTNGYDLIYNQPVIKPALVGLAGPWISGGIEFNWPQHHRPATFLPADFEIEEHADGSKTVWLSDHDPVCRMKGMHGVCLHPDRAFVELKVRAYNRTPFVQTFLWWANVATRVHESYQSFFPPDVYYVADHARRSMSEYPQARGFYYGVNYGERGRKGIPKNEVPRQFIPPHCRGASGVSNLKSPIPNYAPNDLSFYANIPTPCSYMCMGSHEDFFGGYDFKAQAGIIHIANHHIAPGKKQWTWGNHEFGYAWDRNLTDPDEEGVCRPYVELMAGVFTDNQPDFSFLRPGETKTWSQFWYPIQQIGPAQHANLDAAVSLRVVARTSKSVVSQVCKPPSRMTFRRAADLEINDTAGLETGAAAHLGVSVTQEFSRAQIELRAKGKSVFLTACDLAPGRPFVQQIEFPGKFNETDLSVRVTDNSGIEIISYQPKPRVKGRVPPPATEPPAPETISSADELFLTGLHLEQYRHATRCPTLYWREALRRDPLDSRCNNAMGLWHLRRGEFAAAESLFRKAIERLTRRNANPSDGEVYYNLGLCLRHRMDAVAANGAWEGWSQGEDLRVSSLHHSMAPSLLWFEDACAAFYKAAWNQAWAGAAFHALAEMDCRRGDWNTALDHLNRSLRFDTDNLRARDLKVMVLRKLATAGRASHLSQIGMGKMEAATTAVLRETLALDPLDWWARHLSGETISCDLQARLDLAHDFARAGFYSEAVELLDTAVAQVSKPAVALPNQSWGAAPLVLYTLGWLHEKLGDAKTALDFYRRAAAEPPDYCFPSRLEEIFILQSAMRANPKDARAPYYLGNLLYDRRRHEGAIRCWEQSAKRNPKFSIVWRNLGIGYFNIVKKPVQARAAYDKAFRANPGDSRLLYERDQLWKRLGEKPERRLRELEKFPERVRRRDDLSVELCALYNQTGRHAKALEILTARKFQPWEGGEGAALAQHVRTHLALGRKALERRPPARLDSMSPQRVGAKADAPAIAARDHFEAALASPENLGEARHLLANQSDIHYWLGVALDALGERKSARGHWLTAAAFKGDFREMSVRAFSEMTFYSAMARAKLGQRAKAKKLFRQLLAYARKLPKSEARIDYFATSLPTMLLFEDDLQFRQETTALFLQAQARLGLGQESKAKKLLQRVLRRDPNHALAADLNHEIASR